MWGTCVFPNLDMEYLRDILKHGTEMSLEDAIFRNSESFVPANLQNHLPFWENEILKDHPHKETTLKWLQGVKIKEFFNSYTTWSFQDIQLDSYYPAPQHFDNNVPEEFQQFIDENVQEWVNLGFWKDWIM